jgi:hypothetical protein
MDFQIALRLYGQIEKTELVRAKQELLTIAVRYARLRTDWRLADMDKRREMDRQRTVTHNALIDACNILSRSMAKAGEDASWRASLRDRKEIGDFACHVHCFLGLDAG